MCVCVWILCVIMCNQILFCPSPKDIPRIVLCVGVHHPSGCFPSRDQYLLNLCSQRAFHIEKGLHQHSIGLDGDSWSFQEIVFLKTTRCQHLIISCIASWTWTWNDWNLLCIYVVYTHVYIYMYIHVLYTYIYVYTCTVYIYVYMYIHVTNMFTARLPLLQVVNDPKWHTVKHTCEIR